MSALSPSPPPSTGSFNDSRSDVALDTSRRGSYTAGLIVVGVLAVGLGAFFLVRALGLG